MDVSSRTYQDYKGFNVVSSNQFSSPHILAAGKVRPGIDMLLANPSGLANQISGQVGLLSNVASQCADGQTTFRALRAAGVDVSVIFSPEHGYFGLGREGEKMPNSQLGNIPIVSLHGDLYAPPADLLRPLAAVLVDLQDTGNRWYTYLGTINHLLKTSVQTGTSVIILDRPNPQGGDVVEGPLAEAALFSLIAPAAFPARYGLTIGEGARQLNRTLGADLRVVPVDGWRRSMRYADTGLAWSSPSPNMPQPDTCLLYSGTCLIEATNFSEGRGTALPFSQLGAPFAEAEPLAAALNGLQLPGVRFSPAWFRPATGKFASQDCQGVRLHVTNAQQLRGFSVGLHVLDTLRRLYPNAFQWKLMDLVDSSGERIPWIDRLAATKRVRIALEQRQSVGEIIGWCDQEAAIFWDETKTLRLYS